ncbi:MAG: MFS transporter [Candidatus Nucleicultricaceae bacterium]
MNKFLFILLCILSLMTCAIEVDVSAPSFPLITNALNTTSKWVDLTISVNFFGFLMASFFVGPLADRCGLRRVMLIGTTIMVLGAWGCYSADGINTLLFSRFIQGVGASASPVLVTLMIAKRFEKTESIYWIGFMNAVLTSCMALAPLLGAILCAYFGWRGAYGFTFYFSCFVLIVLFLTLEDVRRERERKITLQEILEEFRVLLKDVSFRMSATVPSVLYAIYLSFIAVAPFLYIKVFHMDTLLYAMHQAMIVSAFAGTSFSSKAILKRCGQQKTLSLGLLFVIASILIGVFCAHILRDWINLPVTITFSMALYASGFAIIYPIVFAASLERFPSYQATASSLIMGLRSFICFFIIALIGILFKDSSISLMAPLGVFMILCVIWTFKLMRLRIFQS